MRKLLTHPIAIPIVRGTLTFSAFAFWADGGLEWFLPRYEAWALREMQELVPLAAVPMTIALGLFGGTVVLATLQLPIIGVALVDNAVRSFDNRRSAT